MAEAGEAMSPEGKTERKSERGAAAQEVDVLIIGAGISGVAAGYHLQKRCPDRSYAIIEARERIGGTWDLFRYPGIRSDSDMHTFGFAFRPWTDGKTFADGPAIREYARDTAEKYGIDRHIRFNRKAVSADFDSAAGKWTVVVRKGDEGGREIYHARFIFNCTGYYSYDTGYMPAFEGAEDFQGEIIHPQFWKEGTDYKDKKIAIIGSGATAITLVPAMAEDAAHVTMVQRSPTYIAARPQKDPVAEALRKALPAQLAYMLTRAKNVLQGIYFYWLARTFPAKVKKEVIKLVRAELPDHDVETHFTPNYNPWDQRFCLAPDGDFFAALRSGKADVVTDHIERFTPTGIRLKSGDEVDADIILPATGLQLQLFGGMRLSVDGEAWDPSKAYVYRGMMLSGLPNLAIAFGYTNASWTLKVDLTAERVCRLLNHMRKFDWDVCEAEPEAEMERLPLLTFSSGYIQREVAHLPAQGPKAPWRTHQNYVADMMAIRFGPIDDGVMQFAKARPAAPRLDAPVEHREAAE